MAQADAAALHRAHKGVLAAIEGAAAGRAARLGATAPQAITLIAASKHQPVEALMALYDGGQRDFGENYVQELAQKAQAMAASGRHPRWHLIGPLQRNKVRAAVACGATLHTVDSLPLAQKIAAVAAAVPVSVLVQVRLCRDARRAGVPAAEALALCGALLQMPQLTVRGLMGLPDRGADPKAAFAALYGLSQQLQALPGGAGATALSMGMSDDFRAAIQEGATMVRVGSALFGPRHPK